LAVPAAKRGTQTLSLNVGRKINTHIHTHTHTYTHVHTHTHTYRHIHTHAHIAHTHAGMQHEVERSPGMREESGEEALPAKSLLPRVAVVVDLVSLAQQTEWSPYQEPTLSRCSERGGGVVSPIESSAMGARMRTHWL
jgi:hypothetical protein